MLHQLLSGTAKICVVEPVPSRRAALADSLRALRSGIVQSMSSLKDCVAQLETGDEIPDWVITGLNPDGPINALRFLKLVADQPMLHRIRVSLVVDSSEAWCQRAAFELGLISSHRKAPDMMSQMADIAGVLDVARRFNSDECLTASHYLRGVLTEGQLHVERLSFEQKLLLLHPTRVDLFLEYGDSLLKAGRHQDALAVLSRLQLSDKTLAARAGALIDQITRLASNSQSGPVNFTKQWGIRNAVIVDPDESIHKLISESLTSAGVADIKVFSDGLKAWEHMSAVGEPDLVVTEWRLPSLSCDRLLQRMRQNNMTTVPVVIFSSLVKASDRPVLREFGATDVIAKPMPRKQFLSMLASVLEEDRRPHGVEGYERRIRLALTAKNVPLATQLIKELREAGGATEPQLDGLDAEMAYVNGDFKKAVELSARAMAILGEDVTLLNLLGKGLLKLGRPREATQFLSKAQGLSPHNVERLCLLAEAQIDTNATAAVTAIRDAQALDPQHHQVTSAAVKVAMASGSVAATKDLLVRIQDTTEIVTFMNNRAVAMVAEKRFDEAIAIYETALKSLPKAAMLLRPVIGYNLALAFIRAGLTPQSITALDWVAREAEGPLESKSRSLLERTLAAQAAGRPIELQTGTAVTEAKEQIIDGAGATLGSVQPGQIACHLIYVAKAVEQEDAQRLLSAPLRFKMRQLQHKY